MIIGDRQTGKTAIAIDTILNQKGQNVQCIYVAIGQRESKIRKIVNILEENGAMDYTTVVLAGASDPASMIFIAPYAATALGEYFMTSLITEVIILALMAMRSSRVMPGFRGTPAVIMTISESLLRA